MIKLDLITGFLGSGKTTFLIKYVNYLKSKNENICIIENDYGAVNVDMMLVEEAHVDREMITGSTDPETRIRRLKTKLISLAMRGYNHIILEPSGIFDTDELFDLLYDDTISSLYKINNIYCIYDINTKDLSKEARYVMVSEAAIAGKIIVSKRIDKTTIDLEYINNSFAEFKCDRIIKESDIIYEDEITDYSILDNVGYKNTSHIKMPIFNNPNFSSIYFLDKKFKLKDIDIFKTLFDKSFGNVFRIKGFIHDNNKWYQINITDTQNKIEEIKDGQDVIIVIGENLKENKIKSVC